MSSTMKRRRLESANADVRSFETTSSCSARSREERRKYSLTVTVIDHTTTNPIFRALVTVASRTTPFRQSRRTGVNGVAVFSLFAGAYDISAEALWYVPEPLVDANVAVNGATNRTLRLESLRFELRVDGDRDGVVDARAEATDAYVDWAWGAASRGAIMLYNNDDDGLPNAGNRDCRDAAVNAGNDSNEVAPLQVVRVGSVRAMPATWHVTLGLRDHGDRDFVRIFDGTNANAAEIIGPATGHRATVARAALNAGDPLFGIEAVRFADGEWDGYCKVYLDVARQPRPGHWESYYTSAEFRVSPWIIPHHLETTDRVYVVALAPAHAHLPSPNAQFVTDLNNAVVTTAGFALTRHALAGDRWMQDCMELGYSVRPRAGARQLITSVMECYRPGGLETYPFSLLAADFGCHRQYDDSRRDTTYDAGGNIEVTPPVRDSAGREYPLGRIYYGPGVGRERFNRWVREFLERQVVQRPIALDSGWLEVGHVDEMMTFVPHTGLGRTQWKQWTLLVASPRRAYAILDNCAPTDRLLRGRQLAMGPHKTIRDVEMTVGTFLGNGNTRIRDSRDWEITGTDLRAFNEHFVQPRIDGVLQQLENDIDLDRNADVAHVPVLFMPATRNYDAAGAITADTVNMLVVGTHCVIPQPFGPGTNVGDDRFRDELDTILAARNLTAHYIDDWTTYHMKHGEVHCGTNTKRMPALATTPWWHFRP